MGLIRIEIWTAHCNRCGADFEYIPGKVNSTNSPDWGCQPRCPVCSSYQQTCVSRKLDRKEEP